MNSNTKRIVREQLIALITVTALVILLGFIGGAECSSPAGISVC
jgi:hypothetical protein